MVQVFKNNSAGTLSSALTDLATNIVLTSNQGNLFPAISGDDFFLVTLIGMNAQGAESIWEIVKCTAKAADTLTVVRGQEGTTALAWPAGTKVELRLTAGTLNSFTDTTEVAAAVTDHTSSTSNPHSVTKTQVGLANVDNTSDLSKPISTATQTALYGKSDTGHTHGAASDAVAGFMSAADKIKLNGIAAGATAYSHPATHPASVIAQDANNRFVSDAEKSAWNAKGDVTLAGVQTLTNKTFTGYTETVYNLAGTVIAVANGSIQTKTLSTNTTFTESLADGQSVILGITAGAFSVTWPSVTWVKMGGSGTAPTLTSSGVNWVILWQVGGVVRGVFLGTA